MLPFRLNPSPAKKMNLEWETDRFGKTEATHIVKPGTNIFLVIISDYSASGGVYGFIGVETAPPKKVPPGYPDSIGKLRRQHGEWVDTELAPALSRLGMDFGHSTARWNGEAFGERFDVPPSEGAMEKLKAKLEQEAQRVSSALERLKPPAWSMPNE